MKRVTVLLSGGVTHTWAEIADEEAEKVFEVTRLAEPSFVIDGGQNGKLVYVTQNVISIRVEDAPQPETEKACLFPMDTLAARLGLTGSGLEPEKDFTEGEEVWVRGLVREARPCSPLVEIVDGDLRKYVTVSPIRNQIRRVQ